MANTALTNANTALEAKLEAAAKHALPPCEDRVLDGPASGGKGLQG